MFHDQCFGCNHVHLINLLIRPKVVRSKVFGEMLKILEKLMVILLQHFKL